ncbi:MAG: HAD family hydrolase [Chloroflexota bacterium]
MTAPLHGVRAITFDFGNTLVPVAAATLHTVVERTASEVVDRLGGFEADAFLRTWGEERERQFREEVPELREVDLAQRLIRVLARLRGMEAPDVSSRWDDVAAATRSEASEVDWGVEAYSRAFVDLVPVPRDVGPMLERLARDRVLAILSNWPLAATIDRFEDSAGWSPWLRAIVVSQRVGTIKPDRRIFDAAAEAIGGPAPATILHVGDDWAADVVGAKRAGWRAAYLIARPRDSPLPASERGTDGVTADLEVENLPQLEAAVTDS